MSTIYATKSWRDLSSRVRERDASCALAILAGDCRGALQAHHIKPVSEGGPAIPNEDGIAVLCARHHRMLHGFLNRQRGWKTCSHNHRYPWARELCERRLNAA